MCICPMCIPCIWEYPFKNILYIVLVLIIFWLFNKFWNTFSKENNVICILFEESLTDGFIFFFSSIGGFIWELVKFSIWIHNLFVFDVKRLLFKEILKESLTYIIIVFKFLFYLRMRNKKWHDISLMIKFLSKLIN